MTTVTIGSSTELSGQAMTSMHQFRREVFVERLGWSLPMMEGSERDQYDTIAATYVVVVDAANDISGCARLLPTTEAYMLPDLFPELLGNKPAPRDPAIWELSRFAASVRQNREGRVLSISKQSFELFGHVLKFARERGISRLVFVTSIAIERLMLRAGIPAHRIAAPAMIAGSPCVALSIEVGTQDTWNTGETGR